MGHAYSGEKVAVARGVKAKVRRKPRSTPEERALRKLKRDHKKLVREIFREAGFSPIDSASDKEFTYNNATSDFDDVFLSENVLVLMEYTVSSEGNIADHLRKKRLLYDKILASMADFFEFFKTQFPELGRLTKVSYTPKNIIVKIVYASRQAISENTKAHVANAIYLDYSYLRYFTNLARTIHLSSRYELLEFMGIDCSQFGEEVHRVGKGAGNAFAGSVLPEGQSHFPPGFKVVSFYVDASSLLSRAYVLRRDGWRSGASVYQRMISRSKVEAIRAHLLNRNGVFVNNIVATLPESTKIVDDEGDTIAVQTIQKTQPAHVRLTMDFNSIGLIDGQHRLYSYHEGGSRELEMAVLRQQQNLLVTGLIFPKNMTEVERTRFEAKLFLDINSNQTGAKSDLKQELGLILRPFAPDSVAKRVLNKINESNGPLGGLFERYFFDTDKLKTTTIVSYGLRPLVRLTQRDTMLEFWSNNAKEDLLSGKNDALLSEYIDFAAREINLFISAARQHIGNVRWSIKKKRQPGVLSTTFVNGLIACFRRVVKSGQMESRETYVNKMDGIENFDFSPYKSSQYDGLGDHLYQELFVSRKDNIAK